MGSARDHVCQHVWNNLQHLHNIAGSDVHHWTRSFITKLRMKRLALYKYLSRSWKVPLSDAAEILWVWKSWAFKPQHNQFVWKGQHWGAVPASGSIELAELRVYAGATWLEETDEASVLLALAEVDSSSSNGFLPKQIVVIMQLRNYGREGESYSAPNNKSRESQIWEQSQDLGDLSRKPLTHST